MNGPSASRLRALLGLPLRYGLRRVWAASLVTAIIAVSVSAATEVPVTPWRAIERRAYDARNFTQGLEIRDGRLWVSSGQYGRSAVRRYDLDTLTLQAEQAIPDQFFAEGLTLVDDRLLLLTWRARRLLILDADTLQIQSAMRIPTEGWGITHAGDTVWYSDGSDRLFSFDLNADTPTLSTLRVTRDGKPVRHLNELEWVDGEIWANVWQTDQILRIDPGSGVVTGVIDLTALFPAPLRPPGTDVLNGIARDPATGQIWVTGKYWPWLYAIAPPRGGANPPSAR